MLLDINMPVMDGFEVLRTMNTNHTIEDVPVIMISSDDSEEAIRKAYELGASDYVNRPFDAKIVYRRVVNTIKLYAKQRRLVQMVSDQIRAREKNTDVLVGVLSQIVEFRNGESGSHVRHIRVITETLLHRLMELTSRYDLTPEQQDDIRLASALHDIGKIGIDEAILNKPGRLTAEEFAVIKTHSMLGAEMLQKTENFADQPLLQTAYEIARWHHERWDGKGIPGRAERGRYPHQCAAGLHGGCVRCTDQRAVLQKGVPARDCCPDDHKRRVRGVQPAADPVPAGCAEGTEAGYFTMVM